MLVIKKGSLSPDDHKYQCVSVFSFKVIEIQDAKDFK